MAGVGKECVGIAVREVMRTYKKQNNREVGSVYEQAAGCYLEQRGYDILEYNYRCRCGEIDLIAKEGEYLVFCEVKFRQNARKGNPLEAVGLKKQRVIFKCALYYLTEHGLVDVPCRFDVIGFEQGEMLHIRNAFQG